MPWGKNPGSLQSVVYNVMARYIISKCPKTDNELLNYYKDKKTIHEYYSSLPSRVLSQLLELALKINTRAIQRRYDEEEMHSQIYPTELYLLELLFSRDTRIVEYCLNNSEFTTFHFTRFLEVLRQYDQSLITLKLKGEVRVHLSADNYKNLELLLVSAVKLLQLTLTGVCTDELMGTIGKTCTRLVMLDVSQSPITDKGLTLLTQTITTNVDESIDDHVRWGSTFAKITDAFIPSIFSLMTLEGILPEGKDLNKYHRKKTSLCNTLRRLSMYDKESDVTYKGLLIALSLIPNLEIIKMSMDDLFEYLGENAMQEKEVPGDLNLKNVMLETLSKSDLKVMKLYFPHVNSLQVSLLEYDTKITAFPPLECLTVKRFEDYSSTQAQVTKYLTDKGSQLKKLSLTLGKVFLNGIDLSIFLTNCRNLNFLFISNRAYRKCINFDPLTVPHEHLQVVHLEGRITEDATINLIKSVPNIRKVFLGSIVKRSQNIVQRLCELPPRNKLKMFWLDDELLLKKEDNLLLFLDQFDQIKILGRLPLKFYRRYGLERYDFLHNDDSCCDAEVLDESDDSDSDSDDEEDDDEEDEEDDDLVDVFDDEDDDDEDVDVIVSEESGSENEYDNDDS